MMDLYLPHFCFVALDRSPQALKQVFMACLHGVGLPVQGDVAALDQISREIFGRMQPAARDQLRSLLQKFIEAGGSTDVKRWAAASELTAYRVGSAALIRPPDRGPDDLAGASAAGRGGHHVAA